MHRDFGNLLVDSRSLQHMQNFCTENTSGGDSTFLCGRSPWRFSVLDVLISRKANSSKWLQEAFVSSHRPVNPDLIDQTATPITVLPGAAEGKR
jgi:hypothetical protein